MGQRFIPDNDEAKLVEDLRRLRADPSRCRSLMGDRCYNERVTQVEKALAHVRERTNG